MDGITTFELLDNNIKQAIKQTGGKPTVLEALWDGDTEGWYLLLNLYMDKGQYLRLGTVDPRLFSHEKTYPLEATLANKWGWKAVEKYGLTFYFPSDKEPDDDCPSWKDRHLGIQCADCGKLIIPKKSAHLPQDVCYNCHLTREVNEKIRTSAPVDGVYMYLWKGEVYESIGYATYFKSFNISEFVNEKVQRRMMDDVICMVTLDQQDIIELKEQLQQTIDIKLAAYKIPELDSRREKFATFKTVEYNGHQHKFLIEYNSDRSGIIDYIDSLRTAEKALLEGFVYRIFFKRKFTYREETILRFVKYVSKGAADISAINQRYVGTLSAEEVMDTLRHLEQLNCLSIYMQEARVTPLGNNIV
jgi:hypothetical protein